ncbi:Pkinase-domain-containing protein [Marasmius fiardii PR-910]|nr:Pkinase-domain-containing protein [Marasmius fiardii PR-910]
MASQCDPRLCVLIRFFLAIVLTFSFSLQPPSLSPPKSHTYSNPRPITDKTLVLVTSDSSLYANVEITGATSAAYIREKIFTALNIFDDEDQSRFSIYRTAIGEFALGDALTDDKLFELCRTAGDSKGSLVLLVSHTSANVHDPSYRPPIQPAHSVTPPVLPQQPPQSQSQPQPQPHSHNSPPQPYPPLSLQPRRSSRSRHGSLSSSTSEHAGYDADLDNPDRDSSHRNTIRPPQHQLLSGTSAPLPSSPLANRRPSAPQQSRSGSPPTSIPNGVQPERSRERERDPHTGTGLQVPLPPPPPLSPNRPAFASDDTSLTPRILHTHARAGSETAAEPPSSDLSRDWRLQAPFTRNRELSGIPIPPHRRPVRQTSDHDAGGRADSWVVIPSNPRLPEESHPPPSVPQDNARRSPGTSRTARPQLSSPQRHKATSPYSGRPLNIPPPPSHAPPPPPINGAENNGRVTSPSRPGQTVPPNWTVTWKGEQKMKGAKSMDNLRLASSLSSFVGVGAFNHPSNLQPGGSSTGLRRGFNPSSTQLSSRLPNGGTSLLPIPSSSSTMVRPVRPLPVQGGVTHSQSMEFTSPTHRLPSTFSTALSPSQDPYARPQSALGNDSATSPQRGLQQRPYQSPTSFGDPSDSVRSPRALSPTQHLLPPTGSLASRATGTLHERPMPLPTPPHPPRTSPPRSPTSPRSPPHHPLDKPASSISDSSSSATSPPSASASESGESTLKDGRDWLTKFFDTKEGTGTVVPPPRITTEKPPLPPIPSGPPPPPLSYDTSSSGTIITIGSTPSYEDSDSDASGGGTWIKKPASKSPQRGPILTVNVDSLSSTSSSGGPHPLPVPNSNSSGSTISPPSTTSGPNRRPSGSRKIKGRMRGSTFTMAEDSGWATRPPPEDMYEHLEEYFPDHDLDKPVIEANSGGTSPTAMELPPVPAVPPALAAEVSGGGKSRIRAKKSIRIVAEEHKKRIDRSSRALAAGVTDVDSDSFANNMLRKRSTKLWGSKVEEVTPLQAKASPPHPDSSPGGPTTFKWVRGELIGKGTYGRVYLALNATTGEMMAVKQVDLPRTASDRNDSRQITVVQALKMESETLKDLDHPHIVQYLGFEETPANLSIFLEYVPGGSIGSVLLKHGKLSDENTKSFTGQILSGLEYLHSKGILHRDLKADNILVEMSGVCKISDFGISKRTAESNGAETAMQGTVFWMAPEVVNPQGKSYNNKVDIWSVGCVVLEMLAGTRPWGTDEMFAVMFKLHQEKVPPPVPKNVVLSELADDFRRKCFAINPDERPSAAELRKHKYLELPPGWQFSGFN